jgi:hypothetical protein
MLLLNTTCPWPMQGGPSIGPDSRRTLLSSILARWQLTELVMTWPGQLAWKRPLFYLWQQASSKASIQNNDDPSASCSRQTSWIPSGVLLVISLRLASTDKRHGRLDSSSARAFLATCYVATAALAEGWEIRR